MIEHTWAEADFTPARLTELLGGASKEDCVSTLSPHGVTFERSQNLDATYEGYYNGPCESYAVLRDGQILSIATFPGAPLEVWIDD